VSWDRFTDAEGQPETIGTEGGRIVADEEHGYGARITLEQSDRGDACAITCGVYGWMMHTRHFATLAEGHQAYDAMKAALGAIVEQIPLKSDPDLDRKMDEAVRAISAFCDRFP
jgi:hypothetical protein